MNTKEYMIIANGKFVTEDVKTCEYNEQTNRYEVVFNGGRFYSYAYENLIFLDNPKQVDPSTCHILHWERELFNIGEIFVFHNGGMQYWHICCKDGSEWDYQGTELKVIYSCMRNSASRNVFDYLKQVAKLVELKGKNGEINLGDRYDSVDFIGEDVALATYLNPNDKKFAIGHDAIPIFPFGCNQSQYKAVKNALENSFSVIQGPPGTGKTQTILNIIANILSEGKTVIVVSNNNSATDNVIEKLMAPEYRMGFVAAPLGKSDNKNEFIAKQTGKYPDFTGWEQSQESAVSLWSIKQKSKELGTIFEKQEKLALLKQELAAVELEQQYFNRYMQDNNVEIQEIRTWKRISSYMLLTLWQEYQEAAEQEKQLNVLRKLKSLLYYGISDKNFYKQEVSKNISVIQSFYYVVRIAELKKEIDILEKELSRQSAGDCVDEVCQESMQYLRNVLYKRYGNKDSRKVFTAEDLWKNPEDVLKEYPVVLSTTFSARSSLGKKIVYDYLIMDEASQVDIATGALALSCARNVVIVGDTKQLPNVVPDKMQKMTDEIFESFQLAEGYRYKNSFLQSVLEVLPDVPQTLLKEHYRCHPKIINFCNQKFYNGELVVMTEDHGEENVLSVVKTVVGNHDRNHYNQRQIDVIQKEILPELSYAQSDIGIIAPYNAQVKAMDKEIADVDHATVHKYQGREKEAIILSTVDNVITDFADNPSLLNVAISRAKKQLCLVVSDNEQPKDSNIGDLISYIEYNNFDVKESRIYSIFDYLYKQYAASRREYLKKRKRVSEYDSENLMYGLIEEVLEEEGLSMLEITPHYSLNDLIKDKQLLSEREKNFVENKGSHVDFLLSNKISKQVVLAIEVDGWDNHKEGTVQAKRDRMKDSILKRCGIEVIRFKTNGSGEKERLRERLRNN
ncbi:MAG: AAA domain-containing protein [Clostridiales bacterium]|nr:AAA domain-containing protein [Clostridiales bacterium]